MKVGDTISVVLDGNPTTGYSWESALADEAAPLLTLNGGTAIYTPDKRGRRASWAPAASTPSSSPQAATGQVELELKYWRSFEAQAEPLQTFSATITIK